MVNDSTQEENDCWLLLSLKFLASFDLLKSGSKSHHLNVAHYFMELLHPLCFIFIRPLESGKDEEMQHFRKVWNILKSAFIVLFWMSYFHFLRTAEHK